MCVIIGLESGKDGGRKAIITLVTPALEGLCVEDETMIASIRWIVSIFKVFKGMFFIVSSASEE